MFYGSGLFFGEPGATSHSCRHAVVDNCIAGEEFNDLVGIGGLVFNQSIGAAGFAFGFDGVDGILGSVYLATAVKDLVVYQQ